MIRHQIGSVLVAMVAVILAMSVFVVMDRMYDEEDNLDLNPTVHLFES